MRTYIVTGGAGFIGGCFVRMFVRQGAVRVVNLDKLTYAGNLDSLAPVRDDPNHEFVKGDIGDSTLVAELLRSFKPDAVINFAAESHVDRSIESPEPFVETNVVGTCRLLEAVLGYWKSLTVARQKEFRFLHVSTDEVYGSLGPDGHSNESTAYAPNSPYAASKAASDHFVRAFHHTYGLPTLTTNCSNNYGPYQFPEKLVPLMILNACDGQSLPICGDGLNVRDWLFVEDHCRAIDAVLSKGRVGETYNVGGSSERTNREVVATICSIVDELRPDAPHVPCASLVTYVDDRPGHDRRYAIDASKIRAELGWQPSYNFEAAIRKTVEWYLDNAEWVARVRSRSRHIRRSGLANANS